MESQSQTSLFQSSVSSPTAIDGILHDDNGGEANTKHKNDHPAEPLFNLLNLVIDHVMVPPTPLEPDEFQWELLRKNKKLTKSVQPKNLYTSLNDGEVQHDSHVNEDHIYQEEILVPVIRIFGPIVRGPAMINFNKTNLDSNKNVSKEDITKIPDHSVQSNENIKTEIHKNEQSFHYHQSGCLHIHGAYPYMLARPVDAGPDASSYKQFLKSSLSDKNEEDNGLKGTIDWDDSDSITSKLDEIHLKLEAALRGSFYQHTHPNNDSPNKPSNQHLNVSPSKVQKKNNSDIPDSNVLPTRFIRQISIVRGRGFYTFCTGSIAPFLRIEYYDPRQRWRVKVILERGLDIDDLSHNDDNDNNHFRNEHHASISKSNYQESTATPLLKFRCYEAHIPYTMQFFKDYNLSGMSQIKISDGRFRNPLPRSMKYRLLDCYRNGTHQHNTMKDTIFSDNFILKSNISSNLLWVDEESKSRTYTSMDGNLNDSSYSDVYQYWTRKETSCDIEVDITVQCILNIHDVMKTLPQDEKEKEKGIHWRAVPSLREIWMEERARMAILLSDKHNFLSPTHETDNCNKDTKGGTPPFTLTVKNDSGISGSRLASQGMNSLFHSSPGLYLSFRRCLKHIYERHESEIDEIDDMLRRKFSKLIQNGMNSVCFTTPEKLLLNEMSSQQTSQQGHGSDDEALIALQGLVDQFHNHISPSFLSQSTQTPVKCIESEIASMSQQNNLLFTSNLSSQIMSQEDFLIIEDGIKFCMSSEHLNLDYSQELDDSKYDDEISSNDEDEMTQDDVENCLSNLLTQYDDELRKSSLNILPKKETVDVEYCCDESSGESDDFSVNVDSSHCDEIFHINSSQHLGQSSAEDFDSSIPSTQSNLNSATKLPQLIGFNPYRLGPGMSFESRRRPPLLKEIYSSKNGLHPKNVDHQSPCSWLGYSNSLQALRNEAQVVSHSQKLEVFPSKYVESVSRPPNQVQVASWIRRKKRKRIHSSNTSNIELIKSDKNEHDGYNANVFKASSALHEIEEVAECDRNIENMSDGPTQTQSQDISSFRNEFEAPSNQKDGNLSVAVNSSSENVGEDATKVFIDATSLFSTQSGSSRIPSVFQSPDKNCALKTINTSSLALKMSVTLISIEIHVQCRTGKSGLNSTKDIAMKADPTKDSVFAISYVYARDPGGGEKIAILERGVIFVPPQKEISDLNSLGGAHEEKSRINKCLGIDKSIHSEAVGNEMQLFLRITSIVQLKDPDILLSWEIQGGGIGYLVERGTHLGGNDKKGNLDMVRLLGRTPRPSGHKHKISNQEMSSVDVTKNENSDAKWSGSILGSEWDDMVGAGAAASSIVGRVVLNGWKIMSEEVKHPNASYQPAMVAAVLHKRIPFHDDLVLTRWYAANKGRNRWRVLEYRVNQALATILLFDSLDVIGRAGEAARLSGVEFSQSFPGIRGSQYKVEGVLLRALQSLMSNERGEKRGRRKLDELNSQLISSASTDLKSHTQSPWKLQRTNTTDCHSKPFDVNDIDDSGYFFFSPSKNDCQQQEALECQALNLEPKSGFHFDPIVVCDFTALYPSLVIAYNLCYSTCAGKLEYHSTRDEMQRQGHTTNHIGPFYYSELRSATVLKQHMPSLRQEDDHFQVSNDRAYVSPTGSIFVSEGILKGVLPLVLEEMLSTRAMLKKAAKEYSKLPNPPAAVLRQLEARQLALKYVANVTYGYTSATFSGRSAMPLLADTIVECGRRTLTNAILLANRWGEMKDGKWFGAEVVYGDTDSIFVKLPGRGVKEAFDFGNEFCDAVTASNPPPVQLKLEKVYSASLLQTKKKYCGMKYDSPNQKIPTFEAKGLETVRKDQCALTQKILRNALITVFKDGTLSNVKEYLYRQWSLIIAGKLPVSDFILTGRVRSSYRGNTVGPVQAALSKRLSEIDPGRNMQHKERLPYVIVASPGRSFKLRDCVLTPSELLEQWDSYTIHSEYYITKHVNAALQRCFGLSPFNVDVSKWYQSCPRPARRIHHWPITKMGGNSLMISAYFGSDLCAICSVKCKTDGSSKVTLCQSCKDNQGATTFHIISSLNEIQKKATMLAKICQSCNGCGYEDSGTFAIEKGSSSTDSVSKISNNSFKMMKSTEVKRGGGIETPLASCSCIDCPITYQRHNLRESEIEALSVCKALRIFDS